ncbi:Protein TusB [Buchnera aphidicola (Eriosoma grossulariae)]|uniref:sulfurtransferase complex subunit TusB n=1 Tax=Buchnera aphidicola TaxID=9 RepID=UPI003463CB6F
MLHILINSPCYCNLELLSSMLEHQDDLIALQDGVLIAIEHNIFLKKINLNSVMLYVLKEDIIARGLSVYISSQFSIIDYNYFVNLTVKNHKQITW